jgi:hypothetical protein
MSHKICPGSSRRFHGKDLDLLVPRIDDSAIITPKFVCLEIVLGCFNLFRNFHINFSFLVIFCFKSIRIFFKQYKY